MTHSLACKVCPFLRPYHWASLKDIAEFEALERFRLADGYLPRKALPRYRRLLALRYFPPCDLERMGAA